MSRLVTVQKFETPLSVQQVEFRLFATAISVILYSSILGGKVQKSKSQREGKKSKVERTRRNRKGTRNS